MKNYRDYDEYHQGLPKSKELIDFTTRRIFIAGYVTKEEFVRMQEDLETVIQEQVDLLAQILIEIKQQKLHLAALSDEEITDSDVEE